MKLTVIMAFSLSIQVFASPYGQSVKFNLSLPNSPLSEVIGQLEKQSDYLFVLKYDQSILNNKNDRLKEGLQQPITVKGKVRDEDGEPIPGVTVIIKGITTGSITDSDGNFKIEAPDNNVEIVFSFIGYQTQSIPINGRSEINIVLVESVELLNEVVVTAMNINRTKQSLGYSITAVSGAEVGQAKETSMINSLKGKVAGLSISQTAGGVGGSSRIVIRGISSLSSSNTPLFVVDGIAMSDGGNPGGGAKGKDMGNALSEIDPENIESISVLKGAGASAAYGSRGANGVVLITTKKGRKNGYGVTFTSNFDLDQPVIYTNLQNQYGQGIMGMYPPIDPTTNMPAKNSMWALCFGPKMEGQMLPNFAGKEVPYSPQPNNILDFYRVGSTFTNALTFDSGTDKANFLLSLSNVDSKGVSPGNDLARQNINMRGSMKIGTRLEIDGKISYIHQTVNNRVYMEESAGNAMWMLTIMPRNVSLADLRDNTVDANGNELKFQDEPASNNPYWTLNNLKNIDEKHHVISFISGKP
ncbi:MAG: TonB-dependent receptor plug domain-containing protein [Bacteroidia bacterium]|nr:TonB-dependent receptor plug domain-containing protein [Bacteroidia bacterium]